MNCSAKYETFNDIYFTMGEELFIENHTNLEQIPDWSTMFI